MFIKELKKKLAFINSQGKIFIFVLLFFIPLYFGRLYFLPKLSLPEGRLVKIRGNVIGQTYLKGSYQIIKLNSVLIMTERFPGYFYGDYLEVIGNFEKELLGPFSHHYLSFFPSIKKIEKEENLINQGSLKKFLFKTKGQIEKKINYLLPEPHASLLLGIVLGMKNQIPLDFWQNLRKTGTLHLVVASGQNVSLVSGFLIQSLIYFFNRKWAILIADLGIIFYVLMVGSEAPAVRAGLMAILAYSAQLFGKEAYSLNLLFFSALFILLFSPLLLFDIGFQLSFMATLGILVIYPLLKKKQLFSLPFLGPGLGVTVTAQIMTLPILLVNFGQISWLSPLINALVIPTIPLTMILGIGMIFLGFFSRVLSQLLAYFVWLFLHYFIKVVNFFGHLPFVSWELSKLSGWWAIGYYFLLLLILLRRNIYGRDAIS